jgi:hypothetical protein
MMGGVATTTMGTVGTPSPHDRRGATMNEWTL